MTGKNIYLHNKKLHYKELGKGMPVVLLHGFAEDTEVWQHQQYALSQHYRLILPDLPGSGQSAPVEDMSMEALADTVKEIIDHAVAGETGFTGVVMIGHSMGGYIALAFAEKYPALLRGLGLFHSTAFADTQEKKATRRRGILFIQQHGSAAFVQQSAPNLFTEAYRIKNNIILAEMIARYSSFEPMALCAYYEAMIQRPNRTTVLQSFNKPVLFIIGKNDKAIAFEDSMKQCHLPQLAYIEVLEHSAHMGMWEEKEKSTQILLSFLQEAEINGSLK